MADPGLVTSGSLTDKELQWTSTASALGRTNSRSLTDRDLISEMKQVLNASGIHELREWIAALQESMMNMEMLVASQTSRMAEMISVLATIADKEPSKESKESKVRTSTAGTLGPPLKPSTSPDRPSEDPVPLNYASGPPLNLNVSHQLKSSRSSKPSRFNASADSDDDHFQSARKSESFASKAQATLAAHTAKSPMTMHDLEEHRASQLLRSKKDTAAHRCKRNASKESAPARSASQKSIKTGQKAAVRPEEDADASWPSVPSPSKKKAATMNSRLGGEDKATVLEKCRRISLEELRTNYDAVITVTAKTSTFNLGEEAGSSALSLLGRCLLSMAGHLRFRKGLASRCFSILIYGIAPVAMSGLLLYGGTVSNIYGGNWLLLTLICFQLGISVASFSFEVKGVGLLLGPEETRLDDYARDAGFMADWRKVSQKRLVETICMYLGMLCLRFASHIWVRGQIEYFQVEIWESAYGAFYWSMLFRYLMLCYSILHCCSGLELALDSFGVRFFREMDIEEALQEWNTLQATLRQASTKISDALLVIGFCCLASMVLLGEQVIRSPVTFIETPGRLTAWLSRYYPLMIIFLYTMMRAAAVTEKASRVAPLVNSWKFDHGSEDEGEGAGLWMDHERQYAVQYISQSRAGFFIRGSQLTVPTVQKLLYYLGAISFALFSRLSAV